MRSWEISSCSFERKVSFIVTEKDLSLTCRYDTTIKKELNPPSPPVLTSWTLCALKNVFHSSTNRYALSRFPFFSSSSSSAPETVAPATPFVPLSETSTEKLPNARVVAILRIGTRAERIILQSGKEREEMTK